jgi:hypothetical protein
MTEARAVPPRLSFRKIQFFREIALNSDELHKDCADFLPRNQAELSIGSIPVLSTQISCMEKSANAGTYSAGSPFFARNRPSCR